MVNNINISNLQLFNKEGNPLPMSLNLQEQLQKAIANKVEALLSSEEFASAFFSDSSSEQIKLHIYLTKDSINVQVSEENLKTKTQEDLPSNIRTQQEEIIKIANSLFKNFSPIDGSPTLQSKTVYSLSSRTPSIPNTPSKEEPNPCKVSFDANILQPQLSIEAKELQNLVNRQEAFSEQLQKIKEQLKFLEEAIQNSLNNSQNTQYPRTEEYFLINKLIDNQHIIYRQFLELLSKNLPFKGKDTINSKFESLSQTNEEAFELLQQKEQEVSGLLETTTSLKLQLSELERKKIDLESERDQLSSLEQEKEQEVSGLLETTTSLKLQLSELERKKIDLESKHAESQLALQNQFALAKKNLDAKEALISQLQEEKTDLESKRASWEENLFIKDGVILKLNESLALFHEEHLEKLEQKEQEIRKLCEKAADLDTQKKESQSKLQQALIAKEELASQLQQEKILLEEANSKINSILEKDLIDEKHLETLLESVDIYPHSPETISNTSLEDLSLIPLKNNLSTSRRQYNPKFYALHYAISDEDFSDEGSSSPIVANNILAAKEAEEKKKLQNKIATLQKELEAAEDSNLIKKIEEMETKIQLLSLELTEKKRTITRFEDTVEYLYNQIAELNKKLTAMKKMESKLEDIKRTKDSLSDDNEGLEKIIDDLGKKVKVERTSKTNLENDLISQMETSQNKYKMDIENIKNFYSTLLESILAKSSNITTSDLKNILRNLAQSDQEALLEIAKTLGFPLEEETFAPTIVESETASSGSFVSFGESSAVNIKKPKPPGHWERRTRFSPASQNTT